MNETIEAVKAVHEYAKSIQSITTSLKEIMEIQDRQIGRLQSDIKYLTGCVGVLALFVIILIVSP